MVTLGSKIVSGLNSNNSKNYRSGIVFFLNSVCKKHSCLIFGDWEVELVQGNYIIARSENCYSEEDAHKHGYEACEKALDWYVFGGHKAVSIVLPNYRYIVSTCKNERRELCIHDKDNITPHLSIQVSVVDKNGNVVPQRSDSEQNDMQSRWDEIFRYYRFAQASTNVYDAYRWMFLTFELLMQKTAPILIGGEGKPQEREKLWIKRALGEADAQYNWSGAMKWQATDKIEYFMNEQYDGIRCKLFHSKTDHIVPNDQIDQGKVHERLLELEELCFYLMNKIFAVQKRSGGFTRAGFAMMMQTLYNDSTAFANAESLALDKNDAVTGNINPLFELTMKAEQSRITGFADTRVYSAELSPECNYSVKGYGIKSGESVFFVGNNALDSLEFSEVHDFSLIMLTRNINMGEPFKWI